VALEAWAVVTWAAAKRTKAKLEVQGHGNQGIAHAEPLVVSCKQKKESVTTKNSS